MNGVPIIIENSKLTKIRLWDKMSLSFSPGGVLKCIVIPSVIFMSAPLLPASGKRVDIAAQKQVLDSGGNTGSGFAFCSMKKAVYSEQMP